MNPYLSEEFPSWWPFLFALAVLTIIASVFVVGVGILLRVLFA